MLNVPTLITSGTNLNLDAEIISPAIHLRSPTPIQASMLTRRVYENHSHTERMNALLLEHGIEKMPDVVEENALLVEQNVILVEQRENDIKSSLRLQEKLDAIHARHPETANQGGGAKAAGA
jgi:hypothetical protein